MNERILFVDDESHVLDAYKRALRKQFKFDTALSGQQALELIEANPPYAVVISDMRMPGMDGVELLSTIKQQCPDTVRIMLTGNLDQKTAIDAVNKGDIFRFLNKPCTPENLANVLQSALKQHQLITAEKELLQKTLGGSIRALTEILSLANPDAFNCVTNVRKYMLAVIDKMGVPKEWWMEPMVLLSQIGCVILPETVLAKVASGDTMTAEETQLFEQHPLLGADLLVKIPRMEKVVEGIRYQEKHYDGGGFPRGNLSGEDIPFGARLLKILLDFDRSKISGLDTKNTLKLLSRQKERYDPKILEALILTFQVEEPVKPVEVKAADLVDGMTLVNDTISKTGNLIVNAGQEVTPAVRQIISGFAKNGNLIEPFLVILNDPETVSEE